MQPAEFLSYATVRIETTEAGGSKGTGTGFLFKLCEDGDNFVPVVFTNRHVTENAVTTQLLLNRADVDNKPVDTDAVNLNCPGAAGWTYHPNPYIDLCCLPIAGYLNAAHQQNVSLFCTYLDKRFLPDDELLSELDGGEDIVMVGYPNGVWDSTHNKPMIRRGITATHPRRDYNGKPEFVIDCACFPGSSGSPVLLFNRGSYFEKGKLMAGHRIKLLGILYAGPRYTVEGEIVIVTVPIHNKPISVSAIPNHLGFVLKSRVVMDFEPIFKAAQGNQS